MIIGIVGTSGSGKSTAAKYLKNNNFYLIELSSYIIKEAKKRGIRKITKKVLQDIGNELRKNDGPAVLAEKAVFEINQKKIKNAVVVGIRNPAEISYLSKQNKFYLLGIDAIPKNRYQRVIKQRGKNYIRSFAEFLQVERRDSELGNEKIGLRVSDCLKKARRVINNDSTKEYFYKQIDDFVKAL